MLAGGVRILVGFLAAVAAAHAAGAALQTHFVLNGLQAAGAVIPLDMRVRTMAQDVAGLFPAYAIVIAIGFAVAFLIAAGLRRLLKVPPGIAYALAGAAAIGAALFLMEVRFGLTPIAGARGAMGLAGQCLAGALGGAIFAALAVPKRHN